MVWAIPKLCLSHVVAMYVPEVSHHLTLSHTAQPRRKRRRPVRAIPESRLEELKGKLRQVRKTKMSDNHGLCMLGPQLFLSDALITEICNRICTISDVADVQGIPGIRLSTVPWVFDVIMEFVSSV